MKIGEIVRLKSGGPNMTIVRAEYGEPLDPEQPRGSSIIECCWFEAATLHRDRFTVDSLDTIEPAVATATKKRPSWND